MLHLIGMLLFGLIIGALAKLIMPGNDSGGIIATALLGLLGSLIGTVIGRVAFPGGGHYAAGWIMSIIGTLLVLALWRFIARPHSQISIT